MVNLQCQLDLIWNHHRNTYPDVNSVFRERLIGERKIYIGCGLCLRTGWGQGRSLSTASHIPAPTDCPLDLCTPINSSFLTKGKRPHPCINRSNWDHELLKGDFQEQLVCPKAYNSVSPLGTELPVYTEDMRDSPHTLFVK